MRKFSVIIPAYNCADTIEDTVSSILLSGLSDFEIVIVNDGSRDGTAEICDGLSAQFDNISVIHQENAGVSAARNAGLKAARGEYIWFFDADDSVDENSLCTVDDIIETESPDMLVFGMELDYCHNGKIYRRDEALPHIDGLISAEECDKRLYELYAGNCLTSLCNRMIKREILSNAELLLREDMSLYEDLEFSLRVLRQCSNIYFYPKAIYRYKQCEDEGKFGIRLKRIPHISEYVDKFEESLENTAEKNRMLLSVYLYFVGGKISVGSAEEITIVCSDFASWINEKNLFSEIEGNEYAMLIYNGQVSKIIAQRTRTRIRHSVAEWIKQNIGDFRKW